MTTAKLEEMYAGFKSSLAGRMADMVRPAYMPPYLCPEGAALAAQMADARIQAHNVTNFSTRALLAPKKNARAESVRKTQIEKLIKSRQDLAAAVLNEPDTLASLLVENLCAGIEGMDDFDNRRRVVSVWSGILLPCVVIRERDRKPITSSSMIDAALSWTEHGYTTEAKLALQDRKTSRFAPHPARTYKLIADAAGEFNLDHSKLMTSMILPLLGPLACFEGMAKALNDAGFVEGLS